MSELIQKALSYKLDRRTFLKWTGATGAAVSGSALVSGGLQMAEEAAADPGTVTVISSGDARTHCGNACVIRFRVQDGVIKQVLADNQPDLPGEWQLRPCSRGRALRKEIYADYRVKYPMKRKNWSPGGGSNVNPKLRGCDEWERISWDEAVTMIASEMTRLKGTVGNQVFHDLGQSGSLKALNGRRWWQRLLKKFGGYSASTGSYSFPGCSVAHARLWNGGESGRRSQSDFWDIIGADYFLAWSFNPFGMGQQNSSDLNLMMVKEDFQARGKKITIVDCWCNRTVQSLANEWVPIRAQTDEAMLLGMLYTLFDEYNAYVDQAWIDARSVGIFPRTGAGTLGDPTVPADDCLKYYVMGWDDTGAPAEPGHKNYPAKTPAWAEVECGVPAETTQRVAREFCDNSVFLGTGKVASCMSGWGMNRRAYGENPYVLLAALALITKNMGAVHGGAGFTQGGHGMALGNSGISSDGGNPVTKNFDVHNRARAINGDLVRQESDYTYNTFDIRMLFSSCGNIINQNNDLNATLTAIKNKVECFVVHDPIWSVTAKHADIVLPCASNNEVNDMQAAYQLSPQVVCLNKVIEPLYESKSDMEAAFLVAKKLGITSFLTSTGDAPNQYNDNDPLPFIEDQMLRNIFAGSGAWKGTITYEQFRAAGCVKFNRWANPVRAWEGFIANPADLSKAPTVPSRKFEFYSMSVQQLIDAGKLNGGDCGDDTRALLGTYPRRVEGPGDPLMATYPLQCSNPASFKGSHSTYRQNPWILEIGIEDDCCIMHPDDAAARGVVMGDRVKVWNDRGIQYMNAYVTNTMTKGGVLSIRGGWYDPVEPGVIGTPSNDGGASVCTHAAALPGQAPYNTRRSLNMGTPSGSNCVEVAKL